MNGIPDWELVARARDGDVRAFAELVERYQTPVVHFCQRMIGSAEDAEDLAQECFVRVHKHLGRLKPRAKFTTVLFGVARNLTLNFIRDMKRRGRGRTRSLTADDEREMPVPDEEGRPDRAARLQEIEAMLEEALVLLSPDHREMIVLREMQGLDYEAIADVVGCRPGTVKSRLARARDQLRERLRELGGDLL